MNDRNLEIDPRGRYIFAGVKIEAMHRGLSLKRRVSKSTVIDKH